MAGSYDTQQVCLNGHQITDTYNQSIERRMDHCDRCGAETIFKCPSCSAEIRGYHTIPGVVSMMRTPVPEYCHACGKPYPWTLKKEAKTGLNVTAQPLAVDHIKRICGKFHLSARQLQKRHDNRPTIAIEDEYDVQDLMHAFLRLFFDDVRPEEWTPSHGGSSSRMDFLLKDESVIVETKMTRKGTKDKDIGEQLIIDIERYQHHPDCSKLVCFVYDPGEFLRNPAGIEGDLSTKRGKLDVLVLVSPRR